MTKGIVLILIIVSCLSPGVAKADLADGLVASYPFNGNANDESGNGKHAILISDANLTQDRFGIPNSAYYFDGSNDYIQIPHPGYLANGSINMWVNLASIPTIPKNGVIGCVFFVVSQAVMDSHSDGLSFGMTNYGNGELSVGFGIWPGYSVVADTHVPLLTGNSYNLSATWGSAGIKIFIDGELKATNPYTGGTPSYTNYAFIGSTTWQNYTNGIVDDIRIYNRALIGEEIKQLATTPLPSGLLLLIPGVGLMSAIRKLH
jgi:hypothetical protein